MITGKSNSGPNPLTRPSFQSTVEELIAYRLAELQQLLDEVNNGGRGNHWLTSNEVPGSTTFQYVDVREGDFCLHIPTNDVFRYSADPGQWVFITSLTGNPGPPGDVQLPAVLDGGNF